METNKKEQSEKRELQIKKLDEIEIKISNEDLRKFFKEIKKLRSIKTQETYIKGNGYLNALKILKKDITEPIIKAKEDAYKVYKPFANEETQIKAIFTEIEDYIKEKMVVYVKLQQEKQRVEKRVSGISIPKKGVKTSGLRKLMTTELKIIDFNKIPKKFLIVDERAIQNEFKQGKIVAGVEIKIVERYV